MLTNQPRNVPAPNDDPATDALFRALMSLGIVLFLAAAVALFIPIR